MTALNRVHRLARTVAIAALALGVAMGAVACSGSGTGDEAGAPTESSSPPVLGENPDQMRLAEGQPVTLGEGEEAVSVVVTGFENEADPAVALEVEPASGDTQSHTLTLGEEVDIAGDTWRVSEIAVSDTESMPGSATIVRDGEGTGSG